MRSHARQNVVIAVRAEVVGCLDKLAVVKVVMLNRQPVALDGAELEGRPVVVSKVVESLEKVSVDRVGSPKAEVTGGPCRVVR
jgi:hypothetical protein